MLNNPSVKRSVISYLLSLQITAAVNMVNTHKFKSAFTATNTFASVMRNNNISQILSCFLYFVVTFSFLFRTVKKNLSVRHHHCLSCGHSEHRDIVSAKVILKIGLGHNLRDKTYAVRQSVSLESTIHTL